jgi:hypothetical protein
MAGQPYHMGDMDPLQMSNYPPLNGSMTPDKKNINRGSPSGKPKMQKKASQKQGGASSNNLCTLGFQTEEKDEQLE